MEEPLLRDDAADQERDQEDDGYRLPGNAVEMMHNRRQPARRGAHGDAGKRLPDRAQHVEQRHHVAAGYDRASFQSFHRRQQEVRFPGGGCRWPPGATDGIRETNEVLGEPRYPDITSLQLAVAGEPLDQHRTVGIEFAHAAHVECDMCARPGNLEDRVDQRIDLASIASRPRAGGGDHQPAILH